MAKFELSNFQRRYFGLSPVLPGEEKIRISDRLSLYYRQDIIVKQIQYPFRSSAEGYVEFDCNTGTRDRQVILPKTHRGKPLPLTEANLARTRAVGQCFSASFMGGGIQVHSSKRNVVLIRSFQEEGPIENFQHISNWIDRFIRESEPDYFRWLGNETSAPRQKHICRAGDILAFKVSRYEYGFAQVLLSAETMHSGISLGKSVFISVFQFVSDIPGTNPDLLMQQSRLLPFYLSEIPIRTGEILIIGNRDLSPADFNSVSTTYDGVFEGIPLNRTEILSIKHM